MKRAVDLTDQRFGRLTVKQTIAGSRMQERKWLCLCDCGQHVIRGTQSLVKGSNQSCGCERIRRKPV